MEKTFTTPSGNKFTIDYSSVAHVGNGHVKISVTIVDEQGDMETFEETTHNMPAYDRANNLDGQEKYEALYDIVSSSIDAQIDEWEAAK